MTKEENELRMVLESKRFINLSRSSVCTSCGRRWSPEFVGLCADVARCSYCGCYATIAKYEFNGEADCEIEFRGEKMKCVVTHMEWECSNVEKES